MQKRVLHRGIRGLQETIIFEAHMLGDRCGQHSAESEPMPVRVQAIQMLTSHCSAVTAGQGVYRAEANGLPAVFDLPT